MSLYAVPRLRSTTPIDHVVNTGLSVRQTAAAVASAGGEAVAIAALVHRGNVDAASLGVADYRYLLEYDIPDWPAAECPLCQADVPINTHYAHGQDFLNLRQQRAADA